MEYSQYQINSDKVRREPRFYWVEKNLGRIFVRFGGLLLRTALMISGKWSGWLKGLRKR